MFYSRELFQAQGPLARVWMSANMERKLSKQSILQANLSNSVDAIVAPTQAPLALRVTGKLLLGVVRIYNRKARYLLDDCSEALIKLKLAFRPSGTHDIPVALSGGPGRESLLIPDAITADSNFEFTLPEFDLTQPEEITAPVGRKGRANNRDINLQVDFNSSQYMHEVARKEEELGLAPAMDLELDIDFGLDFEEPPTGFDQTTMEVETGRDAPQISIEDDPFADMQLERRKERESTVPRDFNDDRVRIADDEGDIQMGDDITFNIDDQSILPPADIAAELLQRRRESESPLSEVDPDFAKEVEREYTFNQMQDMYDQQQQQEEEEEAVIRKPSQRAKKQKLFVPDSTTILTTAQMKDVQRDPSEIQREQQFLSRDPRVMSLLDMHLARGLVTSVLLEGRSSEWAPELKGMLSMKPVRTASELKRKREAEEHEGPSAAKSPRLELEQDFPFGDSIVGNQTMVMEDGTIVEIPADVTSASNHRAGSVDIEGESGLPAFDETIAPIVHPALFAHH
jgi:cohesin complex subunit SCC1